MIASAFVLMLVGKFLSWIYDTLLPDIPVFVEDIGVALILIGGVDLIAAIVVWLWRVAP